MVSVALRVRHDHCASCAQALPLYLIDITTGQPLTIRPSDTHAGFCASCIVTMGTQMVHAARALTPHAPPLPARPLPPSPGTTASAAPARPGPGRRIKG